MKRDRPLGVTALAWVFLLAGITLLTGGYLANRGSMPLATGRYLLEGLEIYGPIMFWLAAAVLGLVGWGLLSLNRWARRASFWVLAANLGLAVMPVSSAVADVRLSGLILEGGKIMFSAGMMWYLMQPQAREAFGL